MNLYHLKDTFKKEGYFLTDYEINLYKSIIEYVKAVPEKHIEVLIDVIKPEYDKIKKPNYKYKINDVKNND